MTAITATTPSNLRKNLFSILRDVIDHDMEVIVALKSGKNAVIISEDELNAYRETEYLMRSSKNKAHLDQAIQNIR